MTLVYFDSSAFVKLLVEEEGSDLAAELWDGCDAVLSSRLAYPEVRAALAAAARDHRLTAAAQAQAEQFWESFWAAVRVVELTADVSGSAVALAAEHALRGADAVHLASLLAVSSTDCLLAVWDRRLHAGGLAVGARMAPGRL